MGLHVSLQSARNASQHAVEGWVEGLLVCSVRLRAVCTGGVSWSSCVNREERVVSVLFWYSLGLVYKVVDFGNK